MFELWPLLDLYTYTNSFTDHLSLHRESWLKIAPNWHVNPFRCLGPLVTEKSIKWMSINLNKFEELFRYRKSGKMKIWRKKNLATFFPIQSRWRFYHGTCQQERGTRNFCSKIENVPKLWPKFLFGDRIERWTKCSRVLRRRTFKKTVLRTTLNVPWCCCFSLILATKN